MLTTLVKIDLPRLHDLFAAERQQLPCQAGGALARFLDLQDVVAGRMIGVEAIEQKVGVAEDCGQDVVEIVRHAAGQPPDRLHLQRLAQLHVVLARRLFGHRRARSGRESRRRTAARRARPPAPPRARSGTAIHRI